MRGEICMPAENITPAKNSSIPHNSSIRRITEWKQKMIAMMLEDEDITRLLYYNSPDALSRPKLTEDQIYELVDTGSSKRCIYPTRYREDVIMDQMSFIGVSVSNFIPQESWRQFSQRYSMGYLYFYILVDTAIMDVEEGQRQDLLLQKIYDIFQGSNEFGMGEIKEGNLTELWDQNNKFGGWTLMIKVIDLM